MCLEPNGEVDKFLPFHECKSVSLKTSCQNVYPYLYLVSNAAVVRKELSARFMPGAKLPRLGKRARSILVNHQSSKLPSLWIACSPRGLALRSHVFPIKG